MTTQTIAHPPIATSDEWLAARTALLAHEKELTKQQDRISAARRRLPMVKIEKAYTFDGPNGKVSLKDLFDGRQLIVYHFMFDPAWDDGCPGCTGYVNALGDLSLLNERDTTFVIIARAPLTKLEAYKARKGWNHPWYSSLGSDFNYDFHVTLDEDVTPAEYNYRRQPDEKGERPGTSVFFRPSDDPSDDIFHTYSTYARGGEYLTNTSSLLDVTPYGRQEEWEDSPSGWPQKPTYG